MALFLPLMLGVMVGDVGYGVAAGRAGAPRPAVGSPRARRRWRDLTWVALAGAAWAIVFGVLFGELFGDLGKRLVGDWAVWQYRPAAEALEPLLLFAVAIGAAHVVLGLATGRLAGRPLRRARGR